MRQILTEDEKYMKEAIRQAKKAWKIEEVPIGCVIVYQGKNYRTRIQQADNR